MIPVAVTLLILGLIIFSYSDIRYRSVPAIWFDLWCLLLLIVSFNPGRVLLSATLLVFFLLFGWFTQGFGSADSFLIAVLALYFNFMTLLVLLLLACISTLLHHLLHQEATYPFILHLSLASILLIGGGFSL